MMAPAFRLPTPQVTDIDDIKHPYEGLRLIADVMAGLLCQPRYGEGFNPPGSYLQQLSEAIDHVTEDLVRTVEAIQPDEHADNFSDVFAGRAHILVVDKLSHEGIAEAVGLVRELFGERASS